MSTGDRSGRRPTQSRVVRREWQSIQGGREMRAFATWLLALVLAAAPAMAGTGSGDKDSSTKPNDDTKSATTTTNSSDKPATPAAAPAAAPSSLESELQPLRELIEAQSKQLQEQNQQLRLQQQRMQIMETELSSSSSKGPNAGENTDSSMSAPQSRVIAMYNAVPIDTTMTGAGHGVHTALRSRHRGVRVL